MNLKPVARNAGAINAFHQPGFRRLGHIQLFMSLERSDDYWRNGLDVHGRRFDY